MKKMQRNSKQGYGEALHKQIKQLQKYLQRDNGGMCDVRMRDEIVNRRC